MNRFSKTVAVVTGGLNGIGLATVKRLSAEGAVVIILDRDEAGWERICNEDWVKSGSPVFYRADLMSEGEIADAMDRAAVRHGVFDVLVNNVGGTTTETFAATSLDLWRADLDLNLTSHLMVIKKALPFLQKSENGTIVNVSSINAVMSFGNPAYSAAKAGLLALTRSLAIEFAPQGIRVNAVLPGTVRTEAWDFRIAQDAEIFRRLRSWYPGNYIGVPEDIAAAIAFLAAPEARYVNGASLIVDGGVTAGTHKMIADIVSSDTECEPLNV